MVDAPHPDRDTRARFGRHHPGKFSTVVRRESSAPLAPDAHVEYRLPRPPLRTGASLVKSSVVRDDRTCWPNASS